jgi:creatinase
VVAKPLFARVKPANFIWPTLSSFREAVSPGMGCCNVALELNLLKYRTFSYGHSFGVLSHYYGREAGLEFREDIETVLEPGIVVSIELPEGLPGAGGYREHDILAVTETGHQNITGFPYGPKHNVIPA